jgi:RNA polymerase sigma factor (sigma-70 family)
MSEVFEAYFKNLVFESQRGNQESIVAILELLKPLRYKLGRKFGNKGIEFDDLISQIDLLIVQAIINYDPQKDVSAMRHVVSRTRNAIWNFYRQEMHYFNKKKTNILKDPKEIEFIVNDNKKPFEDEETNKITLEAAITKLTKKQQRVIKLYFWDKYTDSEIAKLLSVDQSNVTRARQRGLVNLKRILSE